MQSVCLYCSDFAYIARDTASDNHYCYVFRCDGTAQKISAALHNACQSTVCMDDNKLSDTDTAITALPNRPTTLPDLGTFNTGA